MDLAGLEGADHVWNEDDASDYTVPDIQKITKQNNILPTWGNPHSMNMNSLVLENITSSPYYKTNLIELKTYHEVLNEIYYNVTHLEPWERGTRKTTGMTGMCGGVRGVGAGGVVSTAYCLLYKLFVLKLTRKQLVGMMNYTQSCYIRGLAFMYIRYCQPPKDLWNWYEPYLEDDEEIDPKAGGGDRMPMGQMLKMLLNKLDWFGTLFPRIPVPIQKEIEGSFRERTKWAMQEKDREMQERQQQREADREMEQQQASWKDERSRDYYSKDKAPTARAARERSRSGSRSRRRSPERPTERRTEKRRHGMVYKCGHHKRHHHCRKHKSKCPRRATKLREIKDKLEQRTDGTEEKRKERSSSR